MLRVKWLTLTSSRGWYNSAGNLKLEVATWGPWDKTRSKQEAVISPRLTFSVRPFVFHEGKKRGVLVWAALKKFHWLDGLNKKHLSQFWRPRSLRSRHRQILCLLRTRFLVCRRLLFCYVFTWLKKKIKLWFSSLLVRASGAPPLWPHLNLIISQRPQLQISHWVLGFQHMNIQHIAKDSEVDSKKHERGKQAVT